MANRSVNATSLPVTAVLPVLNEEQNLPEALTSVSWASEIFVVDSGSTDNTVAVAEAHGAKVVQFKYKRGGSQEESLVATQSPVLDRVGSLS